MSRVKVKLLAYMSPEEKELVKKRAKTQLKTLGDYIAEIAMWDQQLDLFQRARRGEIKKE